MRLQGKRVLVTGADGFIGSHLVEALLKEGCQVRAFVLYNSFGTWGWLDTLPADQLSALDIFPGDVRDPGSVGRAMDGISVVFHLAALIAIPYSYVAPESYVDTNVKGTLNILIAARERRCERVLVTSTSEVYGTALYVPIDEKHALQGQSPYSATKIAADKLAEAFHLSFEMPITTVRPFNTFGPRQSARAIIPTIITQAISGAQEIKLGNMKPTRDLNFVQDTVMGFIEIAKSDSLIGEVVNIATGRETSMGELAAEIIRQIQPGIRVVQDGQRCRPDRSEVLRLLGDNSKIRRLTQWAPRYDLSSGLRETIAWFAEPANFARFKPSIYNR
jgi:NAD dependent epimerase/dehydratase